MLAFDKGNGESDRDKESERQRALWAVVERCDQRELRELRDRERGDELRDRLRVVGED